MENYYTEEFKSFFKKLNDIEKEEILWGSISNYECPEKYFELFFDRIEDEHFQNMAHNYYRDKSFGVEKNYLNVFDKFDARKLKKKLVESNHTTLDYIGIRKILKTIKIFK